MTVNVNKGEEFLLGVAHFTKEIYENLEDFKVEEIVNELIVK